MDSLTLAAVPGIDIVAETADIISLGAYSNTQCDVIICDIDNTEPSEVQEIKKLFPDSKMIGLLSKDTDVFLVVEAQRSGCNEFVRKPVEPGDSGLH